MINIKEFYNILKKNGIEFFTGVPDSLLKSFCAYLQDNVDKQNHIIAANEGNSIALAAGYHLSTKKIGLAYLQNSGQGNAINPLSSLTDKEVYSIPLLLMIGWRGEPGLKDEPQHIKQGKITLRLLEDLEIPYKIISSETKEISKIITEAVNYSEKNNSPYALVIKKNTFEQYELLEESPKKYNLSREEALTEVVKGLNKENVIVSTTGKLSRELFEFREKNYQKHENDFYTVGSMGHTSSIALGIALQKKDKSIFCLDGDGSLIMHMGALATIGSISPTNFKHIIFNNESHDSVGGQPTSSRYIDLQKIARACNYKHTLEAKNKQELKHNLKFLKEKNGPILLEIKIRKGSRNDLGRPKTLPIENKKSFMKFLKK